jgi:hypothetical protein
MAASRVPGSSPQNGDTEVATATSSSGVVVGDSDEKRGRE